MGLMWIIKLNPTTYPILHYWKTCFLEKFYIVDLLHEELKKERESSWSLKSCPSLEIKGLFLLKHSSSFKHIELDFLSAEGEETKIQNQSSGQH